MSEDLYQKLAQLVEDGALTAENYAEIRSELLNLPEEQQDPMKLIGLLHLAVARHLGSSYFSQLKNILGEKLMGRVALAIILTAIPIPRKEDDSFTSLL